jgi:hypothetical protein
MEQPGIVGTAYPQVTFCRKKSLWLIASNKWEQRTPAKIYTDSSLLNYACLMEIANILAQIDSEIARLTQARSLLATIGSVTKKAARKATKTSAKAKPRKKRVLSADARKRIADAQRKRWAAQRAKAKAKP